MRILVPVLLKISFHIMLGMSHFDEEVDDHVPAYDSSQPIFLRKGSPDTAKVRQEVKDILEHRVPEFVLGRREHPHNHLKVVTYPAKFNNRGPKCNMTRPASNELNYQHKGYMLEGDMLLGLKQAKKISRERHRRMVSTDSSLYWDPAIPINYTIDSSLKGDTLKVVQNGVKFWSDNSCLKFVQNPAGDNLLNFYFGDGCWSYVGKQNGTQDISIGDGCNTLGTVCHEMAHALGFYHTQSSYDRNKYIFINFTNIDPEDAYNFVLLNISEETALPSGMAYDFSSVMQYDSYAFAKNPSIPSVVALNPLYINMMGQRERPAFSDVRMMNSLYKCYDKCKPVPACKNFGYPDPHNCTRCKCPYAFSGQFCTDLAKGSAPGCNGVILQATTALQTVSGKAGSMSNLPWPAAADCYWIIEAPACHKIELTITKLPTICQEECPWQGLEINTGQFDLGGMLVCCPYILNETLTTTGNLASIRGIVRMNQLQFTLQYRIKQNSTYC